MLHIQKETAPFLTPFGSLISFFLCISNQQKKCTVVEDPIIKKGIPLSSLTLPHLMPVPSQGLDFHKHIFVVIFVDMRGIVEDTFYQTCRYKLHNKRCIDIEN